MRLNSAYSKMQSFMPLTAKSIKKLTEDEIEHIEVCKNAGCYR